MSSFIGVGTNLYGEKDFDKATRFYTATRWFILFLLPIYPIASFRVRRVQTKLRFTGLIEAHSQYEMTKIALDIQQIITTYLLVYGTFALIILVGYLFPDYIMVAILGAFLLMVVLAIRSSIRAKRL